MASDPEIGKSVLAAGLETNYHDLGSGPTALLIHGSGPGVTAWANWRTTLPVLAQEMRVVAPDMAGFGYTERRPGTSYTLDLWVDHLLGFLDALGIERTSIVGNSFGGALALALTQRVPDRVDRLVLMGSAGISFELTSGLDRAWGYEPSPEAMRELVNLFAYDKSLITDELVRMRYEASIRPGFQESYASMFPAPRQRWIEALASPSDKIAQIDKETLIIHGREDPIIPLSASLEFSRLLSRSQLHVFGRCGHWTQIEHAARFCALVGRFLTEED